MAHRLTRSLLIRIRDQNNREAWSQFVEIYGPLDYGFFRGHTLQDADAADLTQGVLGDVAAATKTIQYDHDILGNFDVGAAVPCFVSPKVFLFARRRISGTYRIHQARTNRIDLESRASYLCTTKVM